MMGIKQKVTLFKVQQSSLIPLIFIKKYNDITPGTKLLSTNSGWVCLEMGKLSQPREAL